jgi:hypothetical protein
MMMVKVYVAAGIVLAAIVYVLLNNISFQLSESNPDPHDIAEIQNFITKHGVQPADKKQSLWLTDMAEQFAAHDSLVDTRLSAVVLYLPVNYLAPSIKQPMPKKDIIALLEPVISGLAKDECVLMKKIFARDCEVSHEQIEILTAAANPSLSQDTAALHFSLRFSESAPIGNLDGIVHSKFVDKTRDVSDFSVLDSPHRTDLLEEAARQREGFYKLAKADCNAQRVSVGNCVITLIDQTQSLKKGTSGTFVNDNTAYYRSLISIP